VQAPGQVSEEGFREALVQSQVRFNRVPEKVLEKVWEALVRRFNGFRRRFQRRSRRRFGNLWCRARPGSTGTTGFPALGFAARFRKICKNKTLRLLGIPPELIFFGVVGGNGIKHDIEAHVHSINLCPAKYDVNSEWFSCTLLHVAHHFTK